MKKLSLALAMVCAFVLSANAACSACAKSNKPMKSQSMGMMCGMKNAGCGCGGPMPTIMSLNLSGDQRQKAVEIMQQWHKDKMEAKQGNGASANKAFVSGKFDRSLFLKEHAVMAEKMANKKADVIEKLYAILTPEQKQELAQKASQIK